MVEGERFLHKGSTGTYVPRHEASTPMTVQAPFQPIRFPKALALYFLANPRSRNGYWDIPLTL